MQALTLPSARGWGWLAGGFRLFLRNPPLLTFLVFGYWFVLLAVDLMPYVGAALASVCVPALSMGIMNGCRGIERREPMRLGVLFSGFQHNTRSLAILGVLYLGVTLAILGFTTLIDGGELLRIMREGRSDEDTLENPQLMLALQLALVLMLPFLMAFWFAPMLAAWENLSPAKALFFSFFAALRNWRAFLVYGLGIALVSVIVPGVVLAVFSLVFAEPPRLLVVLPLLFVFAPSLFASFYVSYREVFAVPEPAP